MGEEQNVSASEVLTALGADKPVTGGTFVQRTGLLVAAAVGALGAIVPPGTDAARSAQSEEVR